MLLTGTAERVHKQPILTFEQGLYKEKRMKSALLIRK
jgi:hypothetical protein